MKTKEELNALKEEVEAVNEKLAELTEEEIAQVSGGIVSGGPEPVLKPVTAAGAELRGHVQVSARLALQKSGS